MRQSGVALTCQKISVREDSRKRFFCLFVMSVVSSWLDLNEYHMVMGQQDGNEGHLGGI
jgi:hypothetical protein